MTATSIRSPPKHDGVAHIIGYVRIAVPLEQVFDIVADSRNEPSFNPAMTDVELLTPAPIGLGTRFHAHMGKADMEMVVELTEFDRRTGWVRSPQARSWRPPGR
jgi:hypothetical protein